jgi:hypothetical protein
MGEDTQKCRWENNIKMDLRETGWVGRIHLAEGSVQWQALVNTLTDVQIP